MVISISNYKKISWFIALLIGLSVLISYSFSILLKHFHFEIPFYIDLPVATPAVFYILFEIFDIYAWKWSVFKWLKIVDFDDLNGVWTGVINSSYDNFSSDIKSTLEISQKATSIKIKATFNNSKSISVHENFTFSEIDQSTALYYFFRNEPLANAPSTMSIHEGSVKLIYNKQADKLTGYYFSGRDRNNHGNIDVKRISFDPKQKVL
jgi:SMODS-associating 2TM, beta-strand rich effector domain